MKHVVTGWRTLLVRLTLGFGTLTIALLAPAARAQLLSLELDEVEIVYPGEAFAYLLPHVAATTENAVEFHRSLYGFETKEKISIFLEDFSDFGHGGANTVPVNFVNFGVAPFNYVYETVPTIDRFYWMANHEMAHIATMDQAADRDLTFRRLFGGKVEPIAENPLSIFYNYLTNPRWNAPRWYHEGAAVFLETWMAGGRGRALGAYDEMVFRSMVRDDAEFYDIVGLESEGTTVDFQVGVNSYLYGTRFITYMAYTHGAEKVVEWTGRRPGSKAYFADQFRHVYGMPLAEAWQDWIDWEREWQLQNLDRIRQNPITPFAPLTDLTVGSVSRAFLVPESNDLLLAIRYPGQLAHLATLDMDSGRVTKLRDLKGAAIFYVTSLAFDPEKMVLYYTTDNYGWRDLNAYHLGSGRTERLARDLRAGDLAWNAADRSLWAVRHFNGISTLVRLEEPYEKWDQIHSFPYGTDLYDLDLSPDGAWMSGAIAEIDGRQKLVRMPVADLMEHVAEPEVLFDFDQSAASNFAFSPDGRYLYGSSYYSGVSNLFRYDTETTDIVALSNAESGLFRPTPLPDGRLLAFRYTGTGFVPGIVPDEPVARVSAIRFLGNEVVRESPVVRDWRVPAPSSDQTFEEVERGTYSSFKKIRMRSFYPIVEGYKDSIAGGFRFNFSDAFNLSGVDLTVSYSPDSELDDTEELHADLAIHHWNWEFFAGYNAGDFYDLFGPTKTSRRGYRLGVAYDKVLFYDEPRKLSLHADVTGYGDLDTLPDFQNIGVVQDKLLATEVSLEYEYTRKSLGAVDAEKGVTWRLSAASNFTEDDSSPRLSGDFDFGVPLPLNHSSLWLRTSAGHAFGDEGDPFAQFFFGGFGNNYVDHRTEKRYRRWYAFPGLELNEVGGQNYAKSTLEWNLPPIRFRHVGAPSFYLNWARPALFVSGLVLDVDESAIRRELLSVGGQIDFKMVIFSNLSTTLSLGYGVTTESGRSSSDEFMISLKILD